MAAKPSRGDVGAFALGVLKQLHAPATKQNIQYILSWAQREGGSTNNTAAYNFLNTKMPAPGSVGYTSGRSGTGYSEVQSYPSMKAGIDATVATLKSYPSITSSFQSGNPFTNPPSGQELLTWSGNSYSSIDGTNAPSVVTPSTTAPPAVTPAATPTPVGGATSNQIATAATEPGITDLTAFTSGPPIPQTTLPLALSPGTGDLSGGNGVVSWLWQQIAQAPGASADTLAYLANAQASAGV